MDKKNIITNLTLYGADLHNWPVDIRMQALNAVASSKELQQLVQDEKEFEVLLNIQVIPEVKNDLAQRIIKKAKPKIRPSVPWLNELKAIFLVPRPAYIMIALIVFSFSLGTTDLFIFDYVEETPLETLFYDRGEIL